jgi:ElaB/YqjD/DUF883 family membrane-anchored ribosome-binding protein
MKRQFKQVKEEVSQSAEAAAEAARHIAHAAQVAGEGLRGVAHDAAHKVQAAAHQVQAAAHKVHETAGRVVEGVEAKVEQVGHGARHAFQNGRNRAKALEHRFEDRIRAKPLKSLMVAMAIGACVGLMMRRGD